MREYEDGDSYVFLASLAEDMRLDIYRATVTPSASGSTLSADIAAHSFTSTFFRKGKLESINADIATKLIADAAATCGG